MKHFVYIIKCADKSLYTGTTIDLKRRINRHNLGLGAKYTRTRLPVRLVYSEKYVNLTSARKREAKIKSWAREKKINLIKKKYPYKKL